MKNTLFLLVTAAAMLFAGCGDDDDPNDPNNRVPDPEGTVTANISDDSDTYIRLSNPHGNIGWSSPDNFYLYAYDRVSICDLGPMRGLGNITSIPSTGFSAPKSRDESVACEAGHGYVVKFEHNDGSVAVYVRLYVVEPVVSTTGGIMGAKVKYQYPFEPTTLDVSTEHLQFPAGGGDAQTVKITTDAPSWNWSFDPNYKNRSWVIVSREKNTLSIRVQPNNAISSRHVPIRVTAGEKTRIIGVSQEEITSTSAPYAVGDAYAKDGTRGIVYKVNGDGSHGMIVSLGSIESAWTTITSGLTDNFGCTDENNGMDNLNNIKQQANWEGRFPAFKWCSDQGPGWYLPAINELKELYAAYCGVASYPGEETDAATVYATARAKFNQALRDNGGQEFSYWSTYNYNQVETWYTYASSTLQADASYFPTHFFPLNLSFERGQIFRYTGTYRARAVHAF
ncbi:MAG: hypothetical protein LBP56_08685 [Odoribacteraceae bacterium]|jgi:hypothetical protein|nr:hypothetical protein [Odoribacteraceae bacterium]